MQHKILHLTVLLFALTGIGCNTYPVEFQNQRSAIEYRFEKNVSEGEPVDILWVIDNSGSMCQEQKVLRDNFEAFVERLRQTNVDFNIAVTTTHMANNYSLEPVAQPGFIQSTPQPKPTTINDACHRKRDESGQPIEGNFEPVRNAIRIARDCAKNPSSIKPADEWTTAQLRCATKGECEGVDNITLDDIFPGPSAYRDIPLVLKASDYRAANGTIDIDAVQRDFKCMSTVGTRGKGIEQGLKAAARAVSPQLTGGPVENPIDKTAPNHGFIRQDANFALIFVTDENDCSHPDNISGLIGQCFSDEACDFLNRPNGFKGEKLTTIETLTDRFIENLSKSKQEDISLDAESLLAASIHGRYQRFDPSGQNECTPDQSQVGFTCSSQLGKAESGDRYDRFLRQFSEFFPTPPDNRPDGHLPGLMCRGSFASALSALGDAIPQTADTCIGAQQVISCDGPSDTSCPAFPFSDTASQCLSIPQSEDFYCNSGIQIQIYPPEDSNLPIEPANRSRAGGANSGANNYCADGSIDSKTTPGGCVVKQSQYELVPCPESASKNGITFEWNDPQYFKTLEGYRRVLRFTQLQKSSSNNSSRDAVSETSQ